MSIKLLNEHHLEFLSLKEGCPGSSESTLVKMPHCWKSHVTAQMLHTDLNNFAFQNLLKFHISLLFLDGESHVFTSGFYLNSFCREVNNLHVLEDKKEFRQNCSSYQLR